VNGSWSSEETHCLFLPCQAAQEDCATLQGEGIMILCNNRNYSCDTTPYPRRSEYL